ncbi:MAG: hypothetical protein GY822_25105 [Deltaproteobacteria bacterium]|nr:hypothetical protein [Deltaproteobacteria bacterium]
MAVNSMVNVNDITGTEMKLAEIARAVDKRITPDGWGFVNENLVKLSNKVEELRA